MYGRARSCSLYAQLLAGTKARILTSGIQLGEGGEACVGVELEAVLSTELFHPISVVPGVGLDLYVVARDVSWDSVSRYVRTLSYAHVRSRTLTYAIYEAACQRHSILMLTYADVCYM